VIIEYCVNNLKWTFLSFVSLFCWSFGTIINCCQLWTILTFQGGNFVFCVIFISDGNRVSFPSQFLSLETFSPILALYWILCV